MIRLTRLIPLLMLAVAFLGWETYQAWIAPAAPDLPAVGEALKGSGTGGDNAAGQTSAADPAAAVSAITTRPLLRPDRQPFREAAFVATAPQRNYEAEMARFIVVGILPIDGKEKAVVVRKGNGSGSERWELAAGDPLPGFVVKAVRPEGVLLTADKKDFLLPLYAGGPRPGAGGLRTEVAPVHPAAGSTQPPQGAALAPFVPQGVPPPAIPVRSPAVISPSGQFEAGQSSEAGGNRIRGRRPSAMPSRSQSSVP